MNVADSPSDIVRHLISPSHLVLAEAVREKTGQSLALVMLDLELIDEVALADAFSHALCLERFVPESVEPEKTALSGLDRDFTRDHYCFPVAFSGGRLVLAMVDPLDSATVEEVENIAGYPVQVVVATRSELDHAYSGWQVPPAEGEPRGNADAIGNSSLAIPTVVFVGYPNGVGTTFLIWNLAYLIGKKREVLLVSIGQPSGHADDLEQLAGFGAYLTVVNDAALVPDRLVDLAERAETGDAPHFDIALAEIDRPTFAVDAEQVAQWARVVVLVTDAEHAGGSWELIRGMFAKEVLSRGVSVGLVINKTVSPEQAVVAQTTAEAAAWASELGDSVRLWRAGSLPAAPEAVQRAEAERRLVVEAVPRHPLSRELKVVARRIMAEVLRTG